MKKLLFSISIIYSIFAFSEEEKNNFSPDDKAIENSSSIIVQNNQAAELEPFKDSFGNFRVHYAGFLDPGFGNNKLGTPAVLELRAYDTPFIIRDGQLVGQLNYYKIAQVEKNCYGNNIKSI